MGKPSQRITSVVLGWPSSENNENIECCAISTLPSKPLENDSYPSGIPTANTERTSNTKMFRKKKSERPPLAARSVEDDSNKRQRFLLNQPQKQISLSVDSLVRIDYRNSQKGPVKWGQSDFDDNEELVDPWQVELILPHVLLRTEVQHAENWLTLFPNYTTEYDDDDDQWAAAKRGDLEALGTFMGIDWTKEDEFESTPLYYACHSGAARDIDVVRYLLDNWPGRCVPKEILDRCKKNAINGSVIRLLEHPTDSNADLAVVAVTSDDFFDNDDCFGSWNIFEEDSCDDRF